MLYTTTQLIALFNGVPALLYYCEMSTLSIRSNVSIGQKAKSADRIALTKSYNSVAMMLTRAPQKYRQVNARKMVLQSIECPRY